MFAVVAAALSFATASGAVLDVPYVPQTEALCGGAAAAMVLRYWGDAHAGAQQFASLIDRRAGGIADAALARAIEQRGWTVERVEGTLDAIDARLAQREPVIVLLADRGNRYHYVVVVGRSTDAMVVHDPSWGPNRAIANADFRKRWNASDRWALSVTPGAHTNAGGVSVPAEITHGADSTTSDRSEAARDDCDALVERAIADVHERGLASADDVFAGVRAQCPNSPAPVRELAGIRFAQRRWRDAAGLSREALALDSRDAYALDVLGSSLFMLGDSTGALRAWNRIGRPTLDRVRISGLHHTRYQTVTESLGLEPGALLTADAFEQARRRLAELPDRASARLDVRPDADGFALVDVVIAERSAIPTGAADWTRIGLDAAVDREATVTLPGFTGQGETWTASWRWWSNRPRTALTFAAPHVAGMPGIWRVNASWEAESYSIADAALQIRETRTHADVSFADWISGRWRYAARAGVDRWGSRRGASIGGTLENRLAHDRVSIRGDADTWFTDASTPGFTSTSVRVQWVSPSVVNGWGAAAAGGVQHVSAGAPLALWAGAGDGRERGELLRAHPMLDDGVINLTSDAVFGRTLAFANAEGQRWVETRWPVRVGIATFADVARADGRAVAGSITQVDIGAGLRVRLPGASRALRIDVAHGVRDGANALTIGWTY